MSGLEVINGLPTTEGIGAVIIFMVFKIMKFLNDTHTDIRIMKEDTKSILKVLDERLPNK